MSTAINEDWGFTVKEHTSLAASKAIGFCVRGLCDMHDHGLGPNDQIPIHESQRTLTAHDVHGTIIGVLNFNSHNPGEFWIYFGYVRPDWRQHGVYKTMWNRLVMIAKKEKIFYIGGSTNIRNSTMSAVAEHLGRKARAITYGYEVEP